MVAQYPIPHLRDWIFHLSFRTTPFNPLCVNHTAIDRPPLLRWQKSPLSWGSCTQSRCVTHEYLHFRYQIRETKMPSIRRENHLVAQYPIPHLRPCSISHSGARVSNACMSTAQLAEEAPLQGVLHAVQVRHTRIPASVCNFSFVAPLDGVC